MNAIIYQPIASSWSPAGPRPVIVLGLSATVARKDGHHPIIFMQCGPVRHRVDAKQQADARPFSHHVHRPPHRLPLAWPSRIPTGGWNTRTSAREIIRSEPRNAMIRDDVIAALREGRSPLVLTERTEHVAVLADMLRPHAAASDHPARRHGQKIPARGAGATRRRPGKRSAGRASPPANSSARVSTTRGSTRFF